MIKIPPKPTREEILTLRDENCLSLLKAKSILYKERESIIIDKLYHRIQAAESTAELRDVP